MLIGLGMGIKAWLNASGYSSSDLGINVLLEILGNIGLVMIVLEASLDLELRGGHHHEGGKVALKGITRGHHLLFVEPSDEALGQDRFKGAGTFGAGDFARGAQRRS